MTADRIEKQDRYYAIAGTIIVHALIILFFILTMIITPIPPFPEEAGGGGGMQGLELAWGNGLTGSGQSLGEKQGTVEKATSTHSSSPENQNDETKYATSDVEESVSIKEKDKKNTKKTNQNKKTVKTEKTQQEEPQTSQELMEALNKLREKNAVTEGGHGPDNNDGSIGSSEGKDGGPGTGGGVGGKDGSGFGPNSGPGVGNGASHSFKGWRFLKRPNISDDSGEEGKVVVDVVVDANGRVTDASPGARGTTLTNKVLWAKARQTALATQFVPPADGVKKEQRGTITFVFLRR